MLYLIAAGCRSKRRRRSMPRMSGTDFMMTFVHGDHKKLIRRQFKEFKAAMRDGFL
jgi:hypothetical protein